MSKGVFFAQTVDINEFGGGEKTHVQSGTREGEEYE
jgi:hypothetical protein